MKASAFHKNMRILSSFTILPGQAKHTPNGNKLTRKRSMKCAFAGTQRIIVN